MIKLCSESFALPPRVAPFCSKRSCKSFPYNLSANSYPINPVVSSFYEILGGRGVGEGVPTRVPTSNFKPLTPVFATHPTLPGGWGYFVNQRFRSGSGLPPVSIRLGDQPAQEV